MKATHSRIWLVTGCAGGIGRDLVGALVDAGDRVMATDQRAEALLEHAHAARWPSDRFATAELDVTDPDAWTRVVAATVSRFGGLDVLASVAGYLLPGWVHELDPATVHRHIDVNLKGVVFGTSAVGPVLVEQRRGNIVNVASLAALAPIPGLAVYSATKYAVRGFSLAAAQELRPHGVRVSVICPDAVHTPMLDLQRDYEQAALTFSGSRVLEPAEVTRAILDASRDGPLEVFLPRRRGWLARVADTFPRTGLWLGPALQRRGRRKQTDR